MRSKKIQKELTHERLLGRLRYDPETGHFTWLRNYARVKAGQIAGTLDDRGYRQIVIDQRFYYAHRLAVFYMTGSWPPDEVDHRNHVTDDNRWANIRPATRSQNNANRRSCSVLPRGVAAEDTKFRAQITVGGKHIRLGRFDTPEEAGKAYAEAAKLYHGDFAYE